MVGLVLVWCCILGMDSVSSVTVREALVDGYSVKGWFEVGDGKAHIYVPHNVDASDMVATYFHEVLGHKDWLSCLMKRRGRFLDELWGVLSDGTRDRLGGVAEYRGADSSFNHRLAAEEWLAEQAEGGTFLRDRGFVGSFCGGC